MIGIKVKPLLVAAQGKGLRNMLHRAAVISGRYGLTSAKMERALTRFAEVLGQYGCGASFPTVAAALGRNRGRIAKYQSQGIEFAVHGFYHVDHSQLSLAEQVAAFTQARRLFEQYGVASQGFRCPYLRGNTATLKAIQEAGFLYDSTRSLAWDVVADYTTDAYRHVLGFYGAESAETYPALPQLENGIVEIPYSLPDDEALIDRLQFNDEAEMSRPWLAMLAETYRLGELFSLGLHPERIFLCEKALEQVLQRASRLVPSVWMARLDEIARWWLARAQCQVEIHAPQAGEFTFARPVLDGLTVLARGVEILGPGLAWDGVYQQVVGPEIRFRASRRPFIGLSPASDPALGSFLRQQGYIVETAQDTNLYSLFWHQPHFAREDERRVLAEIERSDVPLVRFGRWPNGAKSALCITGDIDALTIWDYGLRFLGR